MTIYSVNVLLSLLGVNRTMYLIIITPQSTSLRHKIYSKERNMNSVSMKLNLVKNPFYISAKFWIFLFVVENKETLKHLASLYANNHPSMHMGQPSCPNKSGRYFPYPLLLLLLFGERTRTCLIWSYWHWISQCFYRWEYSRRSNAWSRMAQSPGQHEGMFYRIRWEWDCKYVLDMEWKNRWLFWYNEVTEVYSILCNNLNGKRICKRKDTCICRTESLCYIPETNTTLLINYTPI